MLNMLWYCIIQRNQSLSWSLSLCISFLLRYSSSSLTLAGCSFESVAVGFYNNKIITFSTNAFSSTFRSSIFFFRINSLCSSSRFFLYSVFSYYFLFACSVIFKDSIYFTKIFSYSLNSLIGLLILFEPITRGGSDWLLIFEEAVSFFFYSFSASIWLSLIASSNYFSSCCFIFSSMAKLNAIAF